MLKTVAIVVSEAQIFVPRLKRPYETSFVPLFSIPLIERNIHAAKRAGYGRVVLVGDAHLNTDVESCLNLARKLGMEADFYTSWDQAQEALPSDEPLLLLSGKHLLNADAMGEVRKVRGLFPSEVSLVGDPRFGDVEDLAQAEKIALDGSKVVEMGAELNRYHSLSTGAVIAPPDLLGELVEDFPGALKNLQEASKLRSVEIDHGIWKIIDSPSAYFDAEKTLMKFLGKPTDDFVARTFNKPISLFISKYLVRLDVRPDVISLLVVFSAAFSFPCLIQGTYWGFVLGALFYHLASVLDGCDGEVARLKFMDSKRGEWIDTAADNLGHLFFFSGLTVGLYIKTGSLIPIYMGIAGFGGMFLLLYTMLQYIRKVAKKGSLMAFERDFSAEVGGSRDFLRRIAMYLKPMIRRAIFALLFLVMAILNLAEWILVLFVLGTNVALLLIYITFRKQERALTTQESVS